MARPNQFIEVASGASGIFRALASIPSGADNAIIRCDSGTCRWSETTGSWLSATAGASGVGLLMSSADPPVRVGGPHGLAAFGFVPVGGAAAIQVAYYTYTGVGLFQ